MPSAHFRSLVRLFTRRFFENDLLAPDIDLRPAAIWLCAALATPSILWTVKGIVRFGMMSMFGYEVVEMASWYDKSLLLLLGMVNAGVVTLLCWEALLVDRRDALVLGGLPLSPRLIVAAKGVALLRLFALVAALNLPAVLILSVAIYSHFGGVLVLKALAAHSLAVTAASFSTCLILAAVQVLVTSLFDGRALRAMTVVLQALVLLLLSGLILAFQWAEVVGQAARAGDQGQLGWMVYWPPAWFLGLYQVVLGAAPGRPVFMALAAPALLTTTVAVAVGVPVTGLLWRRALRVLVAASPGEAPGRAKGIAHRLPPWLARQALDRALIQFLLTVLWRSPRHRLACLSACGLAAAVGLEGTLVLAGTSGAGRTLTEFAVPLLALLVLFAVLRWLLTLPAELPASWVLGLVTPAPAVVVRRAVQRVLAILVVVPAVVLALALSWWQGGAISAAAHAVLILLIGLAMVERAAAGVDYMPCATEYLPGRSNLKARWPVHVVVLLFVVPAAAQIERALLATPGLASLLVVAAAGCVVIWQTLRRRRTADTLSADPGPGREWSPVELGIGATVLWRKPGIAADGNPPGVQP